VTPYATLLVKPTDDDAAIRSAYHALARKNHSDVTVDHRPGPAWFASTEAYNLVKTEGARAAWWLSQCSMAGLCGTCSGLGVTWHRTGWDKAVRICAACSGEGLIARKPAGL
jgi:DnaJ-class molecular chaperone